MCVEIGFLLWSLVEKGRHDAEKEVVRAGGMLIALLLLMAGILQGFSRYGIFLVVLFLQVLYNGIFLLRKKERAFKKGKMTAAVIGNSLLYFLCLLPAFLFPQYKEPEVTGPYAVETALYTWEDESRLETYADMQENRRLTVKFWYPEKEGNYPLVVFSHGAFGVIDSNYSTCEELASNGYVVASIGHPYHAMFVEDVNGRLTFASMDFINDVYADNGTKDPEAEERVYQNSREWMAIRTGDENFVLDTILEKASGGEEGVFELVDVEKIGLFGHSMGGAASVQIGRERQDIDAVIDLEGTMLGEYVGFANGTEIFNEEPYPVPILDVNSADVDRQARALPGEGFENGYVNFYVGERAVAYHYAVFEGAGHLNFTDLPMISPFLVGMLGVGEVEARECTEKLNGIVLAFFDYYLKEKGELALQSVY